MFAAHVHKIHFIFLVDEVHLSCRENSARPHFVGAEVEVLSAMHAHKYNLVAQVLRIEHAGLVFAGFLLKCAVPVFEDYVARRVELHEHCSLIFCEQLVENLFL